MDNFEFNPAEFLGSADCLRYLSVLSKKHLLSCARWLGIPGRVTDSRKHILDLVRQKVDQEMEEAENLVRNEDSENESVSLVRPRWFTWVTRLVWAR